MRSHRRSRQFTPRGGYNSPSTATVRAETLRAGLLDGALVKQVGLRDEQEDRTDVDGARGRPSEPCVSRLVEPISTSAGYSCWLNQ